MRESQNTSLQDIYNDFITIFSDPIALPNVSDR